MVAPHQGRNEAKTTHRIADVSKWSSPSVLVKRGMLALIPEVIDDASDTHKDEPFEDADDNESHNDPLCDLGKQVAFDDLAEAKSDDGDDDGGNDRHPNRKFLNEFGLFHTIKLQ